MTVGLPGTGIGGLFYLLLVVFMPVRELWRTVQGQSSIANWRCVMRHMLFVAGIVGCLWLESWLIGGLFSKLRMPGTAVASQIAAQESVVPGLAWVSIAVLGGVLLGVQLLRFAMRLITRQDMSTVKPPAFAVPQT